MSKNGTKDNGKRGKNTKKTKYGETRSLINNFNTHTKIKASEIFLNHEMERSEENDKKKSCRVAENLKSNLSAKITELCIKYEIKSKREQNKEESIKTSVLWPNIATDNREGRTISLISIKMYEKKMGTVSVDNFKKRMNSKSVSMNTYWNEKEPLINKNCYRIYKAGVKVIWVRMKESRYMPGGMLKLQLSKSTNNLSLIHI